jgi:hypothetical protein
MAELPPTPHFVASTRALFQPTQSQAALAADNLGHLRLDKRL